jgi:hypothetical protein
VVTDWWQAGRIGQWRWGNGVSIATIFLRGDC